MDQNLCEAAIRGDLSTLIEIIENDMLVLDRIIAGSSNGSPLHIAASRGHTVFVRQLLVLNEELAEVVDSQQRTALHLAAARGEVEVVKELIRVSPEMCLARDTDGRNPLHVAVMKGKVDVLEVLFEKKPHAARNRVNGGDTVLHLCVKYNQMNTLELLLSLIKGSEFVNAQDGSGNTVLHLAVSDKHLEMVKHLLDHKNHIKIEINAKNAMAQTPLDILILAQNGKEPADSDLKQIENHLRKAGAKKGKDLVQSEWLSKKRDAMMVVASLIATMAFQAGVSPPGGVWGNDENGHRAGETVMAYNYPDSFPYFLRANTVGFVASLSTILLLISGLPFRKRAYMWGLVVTMWVTITSMAFTYAFSITVITPKKDREALSTTVTVGVIVWCSVMAILFLVHSFNLLFSVVEEKRDKIKAIRNLLECSTGGLCKQGVSRTNSMTRVESTV